MFSCYIEEYADFVPFLGALEAWPRLAHWDPPLKAMAPRPRLISICACLQNVKTIFAHIFIKLACKFSTA